MGARRCVFYLVPDACDPNPCLNGGSCSVDVAGGHICSCVSGYGGMACATDTSGKRDATAVDGRCGRGTVACFGHNLY